MPTGYSLSVAESSKCKFGEHDRGHCLCVKYNRRARLQSHQSSLREWTHVPRSSRTCYSSLYAQIDLPKRRAYGRRRREKGAYYKGKEAFF